MFLFHMLLVLAQSTAGAVAAGRGRCDKTTSNNAATENK